MDNSVERDKRIEEIQKEYQVASAYHPESQFMSMSKSNVSFLLSEFSRLQVERDKAIEERDELQMELDSALLGLGD